ncbi:MAG: hypothetical protein OXI05_07900 [Bacteroidota bacterium]|nr:hypothetical protein [Bacteroidota bacterium]MXW15677.1 hypothetical protein [Rhodothermaceae bacterium]MDE2645744.1 hypothetical protein [Bacteroidota bacterium]MXW33977.1 hypothetical protein [Rhodothermaceae bacterium]MYC04907.1 hypothetical protein [Rhodothermaceae bacterium]
MSTKRESSPRFFAAIVLVYEDGTLAITDSDIKGLVIEVDSFYELFFQLLQVASDVLELNHGLTGVQIAESVLRIEFKFVTDTVRQRITNPPTSFPIVLFSNNELTYPLQYA